MKARATLRFVLQREQGGVGVAVALLHTLCTDLLSSHQEKSDTVPLRAAFHPACSITRLMNPRVLMWYVNANVSLTAPAAKTASHNNNGALLLPPLLLAASSASASASSSSSSPQSTSSATVSSRSASNSSNASISITHLKKKNQLTLWEEKRPKDKD